jgi:iron complex outermembrane receptor protein
LNATNLTGTLNPKDREVSAWSPKFSFGYQPGRWKFRYSIAKAYRFPVADELFGNSQSVNGSQSLANSTLKPEDGTHHNLLGEYDFDEGFVRINLFHENIRNAIYTQYIYLPGTTNLSSLMSSIGEVETDGIDLTTNFERIMGSNVDVKINSTILDATIISNPLNPALVGNQNAFDAKLSG